MTLNGKAVAALQNAMNKCLKDDTSDCERSLEAAKTPLSDYIYKRLANQPRPTQSSKEEPAKPVAAKRPLPKLPDDKRFSVEPPKEQAPLPPAKANSRTKFPVKTAPSKPSSSDIPDKFKKK